MNERPRRHVAPDAFPADAGRPLVSAGRSRWDAAVEGSRGGPLSLIDADLEPDLAAFLERSTEVLAAAPDEFTAHRHVAAMRNEARQGAGGSFGLRAASVAAIVALTVMTLAGFGALPAPAQQVIADVVDRIGLTIPTPTETDPSGFDLPTQRSPVPGHIPAQPGAPDRSDLPGSASDEGGDDIRRGDGPVSDQLDVIPPGTGGPDGASREPAVDPADPPGDRPESPPDPPADKPDPPPDPPEHQPEPPSEPPSDPSDPPGDRPEPPPDPPAGTPESPPGPPGSPPGPPGEQPGPGGPDDRP